MFALRYFAPHYFAPHYFAEIGNNNQSGVRAYAMMSFAVVGGADSSIAVAFGAVASEE